MLSYFKNFLSVLLLLLRGSTLKKPFSIDINGSLSVGKNLVVGKNVIFDGDVIVEDNVTIENDCFIKDSVLRSGCLIKSFSLIESSQIGSESFVGPFARVRGGSSVGARCQIGNFVEIKESTIAKGCRINHMAFLGDATLEEDVTIGAGTITCNHNGLEIKKTFIGAGAYVGSNVNLVAPVAIGSFSTIGSGSTITRSTVEGKLTLARSRQATIDEWNGPKK